MALSATSFTVISGFWMLKRYLCASLMRQNTTKSTSTMFSSPVSIRLSSGTSRTPPRTARAGRAHADLDDVLPRHLRQAHLLDRIGQAEMQARRLLAVELAEAQDDAELVGIDAEGEGVEGDDRRQRPRRAGTRNEPGRPVPPGITCLSLSWLRLSSSSRSRLLLRTARRALAPRAAASAAAAAAATLITPGH